MIVSTNSLDELRPIHSSATEITKQHKQIKNILGNENSILFAEPEYISAKEVNWKTNLEAEYIKYTQADEKTQELIRIQLKKQYLQIFNDERIKDNEEIKEYLELVLEIPNLENIYYIDNQVVIVNWGYIEDSFNAQRQIIKKLIDGIVFSLNLEDEDGIFIQALPVNITYGNETKEYITDENGQILVDIIYGTTAHVDINIKGDDKYKKQHISESILCQKDKTEKTIVIQLAEELLSKEPSWLNKIKLFLQKYGDKIILYTTILSVLVFLFCFFYHLKKDIQVIVYDQKTNQIIQNATARLEVPLGDNNSDVLTQKMQNNQILFQNIGFFRNNLEVKVKAGGYYTLESNKKVLEFFDRKVEFFLKPMKKLSNDKLGSTGDPRINITWNQNQDIDLHVFDPCNNEIYYSNKIKVCQNQKGKLDHDVKSCNNTRDCQENITWENGGPVGSYKVKVVKYSGNYPTDIEITIMNNGKITKKNIQLSTVKSYQEFRFEFR